jgi:hypothetical protein
MSDLSQIVKLRIAGEYVFGETDWKNPMARELGADPRAMRFWLSGERPIPERVLKAIPEIVLKKIMSSREQADKMERVLASF